LSDVFHFCWIHKCLTGYSLLVDILININKYIGLGVLLLPLKTLFAIIGLGLFITLLFKNKLKKNGV
jgi:hypothetical protein